MAPNYFEAILLACCVLYIQFCDGFVCLVDEEIEFMLCLM